MSNNMQMPGLGGSNNNAPTIQDNMPRLSGGMSRGLNKMAVAYLAVVSLGAVGLTLWVASSAFSADDEDAKKVTYEEVKVPEKPNLQLDQVAMLQTREEPPVEVAALPPVRPVHAEPENDDLLRRRMESQNNMVPATDAHAKANPFFQDEYSAVKRGAVQVLANADFTLTRGTYIRCTLETRVVSTLPGMTSCIVTEPIYSTNGKRLLIDKGSKVTGEYKYVDENYDRIGIVWTRILTTKGLDVRIDSAGTDALGGAGVPGQYDGHWGERIGSALLVSLLADGIDAAAQKFAEKQNINGRESTVYGDGYVVQQYDPWQSQTAETAKRAANEMLTRSANRKATVTVLNGTVINIFTARDVDFSTVMQ